ncbi:MAG: hypothetical protein WC654_03175 [Patescibacteria group bacterium]
MASQIPTAYVRTVPAYLFHSRRFIPTKISVLVCGSTRERVDVELTVKNVKARFHWLFGPRSTTITCWKDVGSKLDICIGEVTIWPWASGEPALMLSSPDSIFATATIEAVDSNGPPQIHSLHRPGARNTPEENRMTNGALISVVGTGMICLALGFILGRSNLPIMPIGSTSTDSATDAEARAEPLTELQESVVLRPPAIQEDPATAVPPAPTAEKRTDCTFVDPDRTKDVDGKVAIKCADGSVYRARAIYTVDGDDGQFVFSDLNEDPIGP